MKTEANNKLRIKRNKMKKLILRGIIWEKLFKLKRKNENLSYNKII